MRRTLSFFLAATIAVCAVARADDASAMPRWSTFGGSPGAYAFALDAAAPRGGGPSLRIASLKAAEEFAAASWALDATPYRGKRVRLDGDVKSA
ncbi:MAG TPA: hypothetical protein VN224_03425, partial [Xanthomonadales bacterium]|nr:hypothetical protein [Xanthomonadales bacterium]